MLDRKVQTVPMKTKLLFGALLLGGLFPSSSLLAQRMTVPLDGTWQLAEGSADQQPSQFEHKVTVPGLVDLAVPAIDPRRFADRAPYGSPVSDGALKDRAFWYRREFKIDGDVPAVATLLVRKAAYGSTVYVNGKKVGESQAAFTANRYDVRASLRGRRAVNELVIRVGAARGSLPRNVPRGQDYEKACYIPGLFDSVELELSGTPHFVEVQAAPDITNKLVRVQARVRNTGPERAGTLKFVVREAKSGRVAGHLETAYPGLATGAETAVDVRIPVARCRLWSPEDPFLYMLEASTGADIFATRFGMREFHFEPRQGDRPGRAFLNGKPYFMRGSNVTLYRFFEDPDRGDLPWSERWVRLLHRRFKEMHWNSLRYCIGFPPEAWYHIADEEGFLIQDEFPIWGDETGQLDSALLARHYADWMRERWNHPCVVIWDSQNETRTEKTGAAYSQVRGLDLSNRPWDNGYAETLAAADVSEAHPYHFGDPTMTLARAVSDPVGMPNFNGAPNPGDRHAYVINEYGWLWLNRNGTPTTLTSNLFSRLAGKEAPPSKLFPLAARLLAADTEFWRCRRQAAAVMHFCALGYSRPDGQTSDHWLDVKRLLWEPEFVRYVRDAFAPVGLMVDFAKDKVSATERPARIPVVVINDLEHPWSGPVTVRLRRQGQLLAEIKQACRLGSFDQAVVNFEITWPTEPGPCQLEAELRGSDGRKVRSLRDLEIVEPSALGLAFQKTASASSVHTPAYVPANSVDNDPATYWSSTFADPAWLAVDLGAMHKLSRVRITWEAAFSKSFSVQVSADAQTWADVYQTSDGKGGMSEIQFPSTEARHVRILCTQRGTQWGHAIRELEVFP
jgi:beta-galactosidase